jgi:hypothetical protein
MSIERRGNNVWWSCDDCGEESDEEINDDFKEAWERLKKNGWRARPEKYGGGWDHYCPDCVRGYGRKGNEIPPG